MKKWVYASLSVLMIGGIMNVPSMASAADGDPLQDGKSYVLRTWSTIGIPGFEYNAFVTKQVSLGADLKRWDFLRLTNSATEKGTPVTLEKDSNNDCWRMKMSTPYFSGYDYITRSGKNNLYLDTKSESTCWQINNGNQEGYRTKIHEYGSNQYWDKNYATNWMETGSIDAIYVNFLPAP
ncbi:hypothetical protein [Bacillus cereus]|uniref:hypothetical protein n=1 Tax=Bacillus cereus TaxID=1396 RepID=UPI0039817D58